VPALPVSLVVPTLFGLTASALVGLALGIVERAAGAQFCDAINYGTVGGGIVLTTWIAVLVLLRIRTTGR
jgi:hypothetical protein